MERGEDQQAVGEGNVDKQPEAEAQLERVLVVEAVLLADQFRDLREDRPLIGGEKTVEVFDPVLQAGGRPFYVDQMPPEIAGTYEKGGQVHVIKISDRDGFRRLHRFQGEGLGTFRELPADQRDALVQDLASACGQASGNDP